MWIGKRGQKTQQVWTDANGDALTLNYTYDSSGNLTQETDSQGNTLSFVYNGEGLMTTEIATSSTGTVARTQWSYNAEQQITQIQDYTVASGGTAVLTINNSYDINGNLTTEIETGSGVSVTYINSYDADNRITSEVRNGTTVTYGYNAESEVTSAGSQTNSFDANGNLTNSGFSTGTYNEINTDGTWSYYYDGVGNMVEKINLSSSVTWNYAYDMDYQLTSAVETNAGGTVLASGSYSYDVFNNLVAETITVSGVATTSKFAYDGSQIYADLNSTGSVQTLYVTGMSDGSGQLYARIQSGTLYWIVQDREGSVREIINSSGSSILDAITYTDDGGIQSQTGSTYLGNYGYTGLRYDSLTTYWVAVNRWYDPATDQWLEVDPDGYAGGLSDLRDYVGNDWTNEADLGGFQPGAFSEMMKNIPRSPFGYGYGVGSKEIFTSFTPTTIIRLTDDASENYKKLQETLDSFNSIKPTTIMEKAQKGFVPNINLIIYDPDTQKVLTLTRPILASMINKLNTMGANKEAPQPKQSNSSALPKLSNTGELPRNNIVEAAELAGAKQITDVVAFGANKLITELQKKNIIPQSFEFKVDMNLIQEIEKNSSKYGLRSSISGSYKPNSNFEVKGNLNFQPNSHGGLGIGGSLNIIIHW